MNNKIILKISRHIINYFYPDLSKVEILEKVYCNKYEDEECKNVLIAVENLKQLNDLTYAKIIKMYSLLPHQQAKKSLNVKLISNLLKYIKINEPIKIFKYILNKNIFLDFSFPMAILIFNKLYYKQKNNMIVIFLFTHPFLLKKSRQNYQTFLTYFNLILKENLKYKKENRIYKIEDIQNKILEFSPKLLFFYNVKKIYLFGSYVKKNNNCYSDIDFLFICDNLLELSIIRVQRLFKEELEKIFDCSCDIHLHDSSCGYSDFENNILEDALLVFDVENKKQE